MLISGGGKEEALVWGSVGVGFRKEQKWGYGIVQILKTDKKAMLFARSVISWLSPAF